MKLHKIGFVVGSVSAVIFAVACSSSSGDDSGVTNTDSGTGSDTSTGSDTGTGTETSTTTCTTLADGTYTVHSTGADGGAGCPPPDYNVTIPTPVVDAGDVDSGPNPCTSTTDSTTCTTTTTCNAPTFMSTTTFTVSSDGTSATGTSSETILLADGGVYSSCTGITTTYTKQ